MESAYKQDPTPVTASKETKRPDQPGPQPVSADTGSIQTVKPQRLASEELKLRIKEVFALSAVS